jgi:hypothetical protein
LPLVPILSQVNPAHIPISSLFKIHFKKSSHLCVCFPSGLFPSIFLTKILYAFPVSQMLGTCLFHPILFDLIILIIFGEKYELEVPHFAVFSILLKLAYHSYNTTVVRVGSLTCHKCDRGEYLQEKSVGLYQRKICLNRFHHNTELLSQKHMSSRIM